MLNYFIVPLAEKSKLPSSSQHKPHNYYIDLKYKQQSIKILVKTNYLRAKYVSIKIKYNEVELIIPKNVTIKKAYKFLEAKTEWIIKRLSARITLAPNDPSFIPIGDETYKLEKIITSHNSVIINKNIIKINITEELLYKATLSEFLKLMLLNKIILVTEEFKEKYKFEFQDIRIMANKTRWGSCSNNGKLSFHWRLIFAPESVLKYIIVHEMAHLKEMNHSKFFWDLVAKIYPDYNAPKIWLKRNGYLLHSYL